ncbi:hypothetical protein MJ575_25345 [Klebsiella pneumoniae]|nr:hypothetical protein MJ575_25345 [Klebsiella pneumoniae]
MREARRQNRHTRPALTKHTPIAHQRQTPAAGAKRVKPEGRITPSGWPGGIARREHLWKKERRQRRRSSCRDNN